MDQESLYTASKWEVLKLLERGSLTPLEISRGSGNSLANVSQQLRLLEMAGLVKSERVTASDRGRLLYSLASDTAFVIATTGDFVGKRRLAFSPAQHVVLKIWFLDDDRQRQYAEKAFWRLEEHLPRIAALYLDTAHKDGVRFVIIPKDGEAISLAGEERLPSSTGAFRAVYDQAPRANEPSLRLLHTAHS